MTVLDSDTELAISPQPEKPKRSDSTDRPVSVRVRSPFQVAHEGTVFRPKEVATVPLHVATHWTVNGWVEAVTADEPTKGNG